MALTSQELRAQWTQDWEAAADLLPERPEAEWCHSYVHLDTMNVWNAGSILRLALAHYDQGFNSLQSHLENRWGNRRNTRGLEEAVEVLWRAGLLSEGFMYDWHGIW